MVTWNRLAETCNQFLAKGRRAYVEGRLRTRTWETQDGQRRSRIEIVANRVLFLDRQALGTTPEDTLPDDSRPGDIEPENIPF